MATKREWITDEDYERIKADAQALRDSQQRVYDSIKNNPGATTSVAEHLAKRRSETPQAAYDATQPQKDLVSQNLLNQILERPKFSYDYSADPLYQQYREQYLDAGKRAMEDTLGKAVSLTGGYDNSYANAVSQQVYDDYAARAADKIPELYQLAMQRYQMEGDDLNNKYGLIYGRERDAVSDAQWQAQFDEGVRQFDLTRADQREQFALNYNLDVRKFEEGVRQFGLQHALDLAKFDRSIFESDRDYNRGVFESDRAYDRNVLESDRDYALSSYKAYNSGSGSGSGSGGSKSSSSTTTTVERVNKNGIATNTDEKFDAAVQKVVDYAMSIEADSDEEFAEKLESYASRYKNWGDILDAAEELLEQEEKKTTKSSPTKSSSTTTSKWKPNTTSKGGGLVKPNTIRTK